MSAVEWEDQVFINFQKQIAWPRKRSQKHNLIHWNLFIFSHIYSDYTIEVVISKDKHMCENVIHNQEKASKTKLATKLVA